ncbi:TlpA disulfide reductase family protein [Ekhidna sp.]|uniref:TlpA family protein disulfide reductase n=1 Tax=Ekhidna sp. TaxID=2608089 RepID=UPI0032983D9F
MNYLKIGLIVLFLSTLSHGYTQKEQWLIDYTNQYRSQWINKELSDVTLWNVDGEKITKDQLKKGVTVFNFWFTTCKPCIVELPALNSIASNPEFKEVSFIGSTFDTEEQILKFVKKRPFKYKLVSSEEFTKRTMSVKVFPTHLVIKDGVIMDLIIGYEEDIEKTLSEMIKSAIAK